MAEKLPSIWNFVFNAIFATFLVGLFLGCIFLFQDNREKVAALQAWQTSYTAMVSKKDEEIQRLKWLYRITPMEKIEKPRPKGRG